MPRYMLDWLYPSSELVRCCSKYAKQKADLKCRVLPLFAEIILSLNCMLAVTEIFYLDCVGDK